MTMNEIQWEKHFGRKENPYLNVWETVEAAEQEPNVNKTYDERKNPLPKWEGKAIHINDRLGGWLLHTKYNRHIMTNKERLELLKLFQDDEVINDYLSSKAFVDSQVKKKKSWRAEKDYKFTRKIMWMSTFIIWPGMEKYNTKSDRRIERDIGRRKPNENGYRQSYLRTLTISDVVKYDRETGKLKEYEIRQSYKPRNFLNQSAGEFYDRMMQDKEPIHNTELDKIDLGNVDHVKVLLTRFDEWYQLLVEQDSIESEMMNLLLLLDDIISMCKFSDEDFKLVEMLKFGNTYKQMQGHVDYTYRQIEYRCRESIPKKIAKEYQKFYKISIDNR